MIDDIKHSSSYLGESIMKFFCFLLHRFNSLIIIKSEWSGPKRNIGPIFPKYEWNRKQRLTGVTVCHKFMSHFNFISHVFLLGITPIPAQAGPVSFLCPWD